MLKFFNFIFLLIILSCSKKEIIPKPKGYLSLNYPKTSYKILDIDRPYSFEVSKFSKVINQPKQWLKIDYPNLRADIDITYRPVNNNIRELLIDAEKLFYEHAIKADQIISRDYVNKENKVYGKFVEITGNAASQLQFHVTDSTKNFIKGSLFFKTAPNYDSILPAVDYIKKDMIKMMETLKWKK